jgi:hypothetical protein
MRWHRGLAGLAAAVALFAACSAFELLGPRAGPYPDACDDFDFEARQCAAIVARAARSQGLAPEDVTGAELLPYPRPEGGTLSAPPLVIVRLHLGLGRVVDTPVCGGIGGMDDIACFPDAGIMVGVGVDQDVPCSGEPPAGCATPPPRPAPEVIAKARPLRVAALDVPLDHVGSYQVAVGEAGLPDGYLTTRSLELTDHQPEDYWIVGGVRLEVRPADPSRPPIGSRYREPFDGVELVNVFLEFEVTELQPGAVLRVRDIVVE